MFSYSELKPGVIFIKDGEPYTVLDYQFMKKQRGKPIAQLKIKNLLSGKVTDYTAHQNESFEAGEIERIPAQFIYTRCLPTGRQEYWFKDPNDSSKRFSIKEDVVGSAKNYLKPDLEVKALSFQNRIINIELPVKVNLKVTDAPPNIRGSTAEGGTKIVTTETGFKINAPLFIEQGDVIRVNTEKGEYAERAGKN